MVGTNVTGKSINLAQLQSEMGAAGVNVTALGLEGPGMGQTGSTYLFTYDAQGQPVDLPPGSDTVVAAHVAMRDKTTEEYAAEFNAPETSAARKQEIRDMQSGLLPHEQVPMEAS